MIPTVQDWAKGVYQSWSSLRVDEANAKQMKVFFCTPALLALGVQTLGSLPLQPVVATIVIADAVFHYVAVRNPEFCQKAKKYEWVFYGVRLTVLTWSVGHLFQALSTWTTPFPLTGASILRTYTTYHPGRLTSFNGGPYRHNPYDTHCFDRWALSWPVTVGGMVGMSGFAHRIHQWIAKGEASLIGVEPPKSVNANIKSSEQYLPKAPLWVAVLQQVVYVSLAIFSKSHLVFAGLSGLNLYTFYESVLYTRACLRQIIIILRIWRLSNKAKVEVFRYEERFVVRKDAKEEVSSEIQRLFNEAETFQPFNFQPSEDGTCCRMSTQIIPSFFSEQSPSEQVLDRQFYLERHWIFALKEHHRIKCEFTPLDYKEGEEILVPIQELDQDSRMLRVTLENGVVVDFPDVLTSQVLKMKLEGKTISAKVEATKVKKGQLYLSCNSTALPKGEVIVFTWGKELYKTHFNLSATVNICEKGKEQAQCSGCSNNSILFYYEFCEPNSAVCKSCIQTDFENKVKSFTIVNKAIKLYDNNSFLYKLYAQEDQLPKGFTFSISAFDGLGDIVWLDYQVGKRVEVQLQRFLAQGVAIGWMLDGTTVCLHGVDPKKAEEMIQSKATISAQILGKRVQSGTLFLNCISRALPPKSMPLSWEALLKLNDKTPVKLEYRVEFKPNLSDQDEECGICASASELLFYTCADENQSACITCLEGHVKVRYSKLKIVNYKKTERSPEGEVISSYESVCFDKEMLPNCMYCRAPVVDESQILVWVGEVQAKVHFLDYKIGEIVQFTIEDLLEDGTPYGELDDGTFVQVSNLQWVQAAVFQSFQLPINAKIFTKTIQNGQLNLGCEFISLSTEIPLQ